jgi:hypothetical protein
MGLSFLAIVASSLVVVDDFNIRWTFHCPNKADPELADYHLSASSMCIVQQRSFQ